MLREMPTRLSNRRVFGMFPGLGDQYVNMARGLYEVEPEFRQVVDRCCELLIPEVGLDLRTVIYPAQTSAPKKAAADLDLRRMFGRGEEAPSAEAQRLNQTHLAQPALFVIEYALATLWQSRKLFLDAVIGYSLGEYVAGCLTGMLSLEDSLKLVARRAQLIAKLPAGAMLAVPLPEAQLASMLGPHLAICAVNGTEICVIGGPPEAVEELQGRLRSTGTVSRRVQTSHAFHSRMMAPIADEVTRLAATFTQRPPRIPLISNVTGAPLSAAQAVDPSYYAVHLCQPVRFSDGIRLLWQEPDPVFVELGPGQTLTSLAQQNAPAEAGEECLVLYTLRHAYDDAPDTAVLATATARLQAAGVIPASASAAAGGAKQAAPAPAFREPQSETERALAAIWKEMLRLPRVGLDDHFFERGGNSLIAARVLVRVRKRFQIDLKLRQLYLSSTLESFAAALTEVIAARTGVAATAPRSVASELERPAASPPRLMPFILPDDTEIVHVSEAESRHFYHDIFELRSYVKQGIRIPDGGCVFDVGANIGMFTLFASREARDVQIYSFEPAPPLFAHLSHNVALHKVPARLFNVGLSNAERTAEFTFYPNSSGMSSFHADLDEEKDVLRAIMKNQRQRGEAESHQSEMPDEELLDARFSSQTLQCRLRRLTDVIAETKVERIDLLKVDVQKCEHEVLAGLADRDWPKIRQIAIEVHDMEGRLAHLCGLLSQKGFRVIAEQDPLYAGTNIHNLYAVRS